MPLFSRGGRRVRSSETAEMASEPMGAPALRELMAQLGATEDMHFAVLDLAAAAGDHLQSFRPFSSRFHIAGLAEELSSWHAGEAPSAPDPNELMPLPDDIPFDVVLAWNLFDHLPDEALLRLAGHLRAHCRTGARLHALVQTGTRMPVDPGRFRLQEDGGLVWEHRPEPRMDAPRRAQRTLERLLPGFGAHRARLLQNGFQEYLFVANPTERH